MTKKEKFGILKDSKESKELKVSKESKGLRHVRDSQSHKINKGYKTFKNFRGSKDYDLKNCCSSSYNSYIFEGINSFRKYQKTISEGLRSQRLSQSAYKRNKRISNSPFTKARLLLSKEMK